MGEPAVTHEIVGVYRRVHVILVNAYRNAHQHVLGALYNFAVDFQQVASLQRLESEIIVIEIPIINDL